MKKFLVNFSQTFRNEKKEVVAIVSSEVSFEAESLYIASKTAELVVKGLYPNAEIEVINVSSTKPRKEKEVAAEVVETAKKA